MYGEIDGGSRTVKVDSTVEWVVGWEMEGIVQSGGGQSYGDR